MFLVALLVGLVPREIGRRVDPYDAYPSQFAATLEPRAIWEHARLLALHCLPRLIAGTELDHLEKTPVAAIQARGMGLLSLSGVQIRSACSRAR